MRSETQLGFEEWLPRRAALLTALGMWVAGFVLAGASAWRIQDQSRWTDEANQSATSPAATPNTSCDNPTSDMAADTAEPQGGAVFMPGDVVVGRRTPGTGVTQMQKP